MEYKFVAPLYNIKISSPLNRGKIITNNMRITNSKENFLKIFNQDSGLEQFIGVLEFDNLTKSTYIVATGDYDMLYKSYESHKIEKNNYYYIANALMRRIQTFCNILWFIKDNSVHTEQGFIVIGTDTYAPIATSTGTAFSYVNAKGAYEDVTFTLDEIALAIENYNKLAPSDSESLNIGERIIPDVYNNKSTRVERATQFLQAARREYSVPVKIMNYCTVLECLFTRDNSELTHKISERFAKIMGGNLEDRMTYYNLIKKAYTIRSLVIHGQPISHKKLLEANELAIEFDNAIRILFNKLFFDEEIVDFFDQTDDELDKSFLKLVLE
ncbi:HEPN domain-containing protein [Bacillus weihaiensis]|uniref:HEPN domain-containing protein n=1 Tax=Bacillus weihaiensis TaxID=1547283 RepID=UPI00235201CC|nr:HEPN domain-containing protein [Bacillus weihaiensis]